MGTELRRILIKVDSKDSREIKQMADYLGAMNKNIKSTTGNLGFLTNAFRGWIGYLGVREVVRMSDEMQNLFNRLKLVTGSTEAAEDAMAGLDRLATRTNQSISGVAEIYNRLAVSLGKAGRNTQQVQALTETLVNTFRLSGATTTETTNTIIQLSQAFSSGELRGQELRSVMEQNATLALLLRERFGSDIYKKAADGAINIKDILSILADNQERVNREAQALVPTIEQSVTRAFNKLSLAIGNANRKLGISSGFAKSLQFVVDNIGIVTLAIGTLALSAIPALTVSFGGLSKALLALNLNPMILAVGSIVIGFTLLARKFEVVESLALKFAAVVNVLGAAVLKLTSFLSNMAEKLTLGIVSLRTFRGVADGMADQFLANADASYSLSESVGLFREVTEQAADPLADYKKQLEDLAKNFDKNKPEKVKKIREELAELNQAFLKGAFSAEQYYTKILNFDLYKANRDFKEGRIDLERYNAELARIDLAQLNQQFAGGVISLEQFRQKVDENTIARLDNQLKNGTISLLEFNAEMSKLNSQFSLSNSFFVGTNDYLESIGSLSSNVADGIRSTFSTLENSLTDFIKNGKFNFSNFTKAILDDLARIIIRATILRPLAQGLLNFAGAGTTFTGDANIGTGTSLQAAKGAAFDNGVRKFAKGGIVNSPTLFGYNGNRTGLMGEAGTEAILPLSRGSGGDLGVKASVTPVTINIHNNTGSEVQTKETTGPNGERTIDVLIIGKVREGIASGQFDKALRQGFGLTRKGS